MSQLSSVAKQPLRKCAGCGMEGAGFKHCGGCLSVFYCSSACQSTSWAGHKLRASRSGCCESKRRTARDMGSTKISHQPQPQPQSQPQPQAHSQPQPMRYVDRDIAVACACDKREELHKVLQQSGLDVNWANSDSGATAAWFSSQVTASACP
jgi:hypothetical protein